MSRTWVLQFNIYLSINKRVSILFWMQIKFPVLVFYDAEKNN